MAGLGKNAYTKQMALYIKNRDYQRAIDFGKEFTREFPDEMIAHFLLAKAAFSLGNYEESKTEGRKAFNLAKSNDDMVTCAVLTSAAYFELHEYSKGLEFLRKMEDIKKTEDLETLLFVFSLALRDEKEALKHIEHLYELNEETAEDLITRYLK